MKRPSTWLIVAGLCTGSLPGPLGAAEPPAPPSPPAAPPAQATAGPTPSETALLQALVANPMTAPYRFATTIRNGRVVLSGRVGTKRAHDVAVQTAIALGIRFDDDLVIDTAETLRAAVPAQVRIPAYGYNAGAVAGPAAGPAAAPAPSTGAYPAPALGAGPAPGFQAGYGQMTATLPYPPPTYGLSAAGPGFLYPPPLFGRYDDPFWGFEPPVITYPAWWGAQFARRMGEPNAVAPPVPTTTPAPSGASPSSLAPSAATGVPVGPSPSDGTVEMTIDPLGVARLTGFVPTLAARVAVGQRLAQMPGVTQVINLLDVRETATPASTPPAISSSPIPPPPPSPAGPAPRPPDGIVADATDPSSRLSQAIARRPDLAGLPIRTSVRDGVATLSGKVPTAYEAMLAFRAAQQLPGIRAVDDRLEFEVPDGEHKNPLIEKGRPEEVEPYLEAQIRRQVGDQAHIDRVRLVGDRLEIRGTVPDLGDRPRVEAILRSMPLLRGFQVEATFAAE